MKQPRIVVYDGELAVIIPLGAEVSTADLFALIGAFPSVTEQRLPAETPPSLPRPNDTATFACTECGKTFGTEQGLTVHSRRMHKQPETEIEFSALQPGQTASRVYTDGRGICELCGSNWKGHERCRVCAALIGTGHPSLSTDSKGRCRKCADAQL